MTRSQALRPFEVDFDYLQAHINEMVAVTFSDLQSQFLILPKGPNFVEYSDFQNAYEVLKRRTASFSNLTEETVWAALREDALTFMVLRTILGMTPPEWAELARTERGVDVPQNAARGLDGSCRTNQAYFASMRPGKTLERAHALVAVAVQYITQGATSGADDVVHRLAKGDTAEGLASLQYIATHDVPYAMLLYERYLGRPFASHRDSISEMIGDVMESAIEERLSRLRISFRKTRRAEKVPGFEQAPDFFVPDEFNPAVLIEAKITGDDGTARDKVARILRLCSMRDERSRRGQPELEVVACIDGRGFGVRREDMRQLLTQTRGKVFTLRTLDALVAHTQLRDFVPR